MEILMTSGNFSVLSDKASYNISFERSQEWLGTTYLVGKGVAALFHIEKIFEKCPFYFLQRPSKKN